MTEHEMIPRAEGLSPMEASALVHEEASELAERLGQKAYQEHCNVLWEIDMMSEAPIRRFACGCARSRTCSLPSLSDFGLNRYVVGTSALSIAFDHPATGSSVSLVALAA